MRNVNVTTSSQQVVPYDRNRRWVILQNQSSSVIRLRFGSGPGESGLSASLGFELAPDESIIIQRGLEDNDTGLANQSIHALHGSTGNRVLHIQEGF